MDNNKSSLPNERRKSFLEAMKPSDLRIGNIIEFNGLYLPIGELSNKGFDEWWVVGLNDDQILTASFSHKGIRPVPLNKAWAEKFNMTIDKEWSMQKNKSVDLFGIGIGSSAHLYYSKIDGFYIDGKFMDEPIYLHSDGHVHQLQNLYFALTGEDLILDTDSI